MMIDVQQANRSFGTGVAPLGSFRVFHESALNPKKVVKRVNMVEVNGNTFQASDRFWNSLLSRYGFGDSTFNYFSHKEVFDRIVQVKGNDELRYTIEGSDQDTAKRPAKMLAVVSAKAKIPEIPELLKLFGKFEGRDLTYSGGTFVSRFNPFSGEREVNIGPDAFNERFAVEVPIDGWGKVKTYLEMLRQICSNGAIAMAPAFRSTVKVGDDMLYALDRVLGSYDNGEGFVKLRERFDMAQKSWASVRECNGFIKIAARWPQGQTRMRQIVEATGDFCRVYGISSINLVPHKQQSALPARCRVYDLINLASEMATHHSSHEESRAYQGYIGTMLTENFDLEGTVEQVPEFKDFQIN